jgi:hypothetical protein
VAQRQGAAAVTSTATGWVAWVLLAGVLLFLVGVLHVLTGMAAWLRPEILAGTRSDLLLPVGLDTLAWLYVGFGVVVAIAGVGLLLGRLWARVAATLLAVLAILVNFAFAKVYPLWSVMTIVLSAIVIYAVVAHGREVAEAYGHDA